MFPGWIDKAFSMHKFKRKTEYNRGKWDLLYWGHVSQARQVKYFRGQFGGNFRSCKWILKAN